VVLVQVENEYGAFGDDRAYLEAVADIIRRAGITVPLVTVDQPVDQMLEAGGLDGVLRTASFGSRSAERLRTLRAHQPTGPLMCMEFWDGWFDQWGGHHHTTSVEQAAEELDTLLAAGASVNVYMFHGGTSFGLTSGANDKGTYRPTVTSYDYDAPLDEAGDPTPKYLAFRDVIARHAPVPDDLPAPRTPAPEPIAPLGEPVPLLADPDAWGRATEHRDPPTLDELEGCPKLAVYAADLAGSDGPVVLGVAEVRDRATVLLDGDPVGVLEREHHAHSLVLPRGRGRLTLVVEDQGGVNYGPRIGETKGLIGPVRLSHPGGDEEVRDWSVRGLDLDAVPGLWDRTDERGARPGPTAWRATFDAAKPERHFLHTSGWGKGIAWVNGFCLGRYWRRGPQETLFVPGPVVREGRNELVVLELDVMADPVARFVAAAVLGPLEP
jgi:beta-galactosidase